MIYPILLQWHGYFQWAILIYLPIMISLSWRGWKYKKEYKKWNEIGARISIGLVHSQMLLGILLMTHSPKVSFVHLADSTTFFWSILHPSLMMTAIVLVTLALMVVRNLSSSQKKFGWSTLFYGSGWLLMILSVVIPLAMSSF